MPSVRGAEAVPDPRPNPKAGGACALLLSASPPPIPAVGAGVPKENVVFVAGAVVAAPEAGAAAGVPVLRPKENDDVAPPVGAAVVVGNWNTMLKLKTNNINLNQTKHAKSYQCDPSLEFRNVVGVGNQLNLSSS